MYNRRLIGVVTTLAGRAVQSIGYRRYLPLGDPSVLVANLDRWGADEVLLQVIDRSERDQGPDLETLGRVAAIGISTPLVYSGGIRNVDDAVSVIRGGADRVVVDGLLHRQPHEVSRITELLGAQSVIAAVPVHWESGRAIWWDYLQSLSKEFPQEIADFLESKVISEVLIVDHLNEGSLEGFDMRLLECLPFYRHQLIVFGGIATPSLARRVASHERVSAIAVGNALNYRELAVQHFKLELASVGVRPPGYRGFAEEFSLGY